MKHRPSNILQQGIPGIMYQGQTLIISPKNMVYDMQDTLTETNTFFAGLTARRLH